MKAWIGRGTGVVALALLFARPALASEWSAQSEQHFQRGAALLYSESPDYEEAYRQFRLAYEGSRDFRILPSLARAAEALERDGEAIQAYLEYLSRAGEAIAPDEQNAIQRRVAALQSSLVRVTLSSSVPDLTLVSSRVGSDVPPQVYRLEGGRLELELRAGTHLVTARSGGNQLEWQVTLAPGAAAEHHFEFVGQQASKVELQLDDLPRGRSNFGTAGFVAAGVGSAALVAGAVTGLLVLAREQDARTQCRDGPRGGTECPESARHGFERAQSLATATNVLLIGGGALALVGVGTVMISGKDSDRPSQALRLVPTLGKHAKALHLVGSF